MEQYQEIDPEYQDEIKKIMNENRQIFDEDEDDNEEEYYGEEEQRYH